MLALTFKDAAGHQHQQAYLEDYNACSVGRGIEDCISESNEIKTQNVQHDNRYNIRYTLPNIYG